MQKQRTVEVSENASTKRGGEDILKGTVSGSFSVPEGNNRSPSTSGFQMLNNLLKKEC